MKIAVVGPGAMGCLFAARLAQSGAKTYLVDHRGDRAEVLEKEGIKIESDGGVITARPQVSLSVPNGADVAIVLTKAYDTGSLRFPAEIPVLSLQNGLGNVEGLCALVGSARVLAGATTEAATLLGPGHVRHVASGETAFGAWTSCPTDHAQQALSAAGFQVDVTDSPGQLIWEKTTLNAGINPLSAILGVPNGQLLKIKEARQLMRDLVVEAAKVAATEGYRFAGSLVEQAEALCEKTAENISSMLQDVRASRRTEIDAISGEILRRAQLASLPTPRTRVVYQIVRSLEQR